MSVEFIYGTAWKEERTEECVTQALAAGFRAIDTANQAVHYNEVGVGKAIKKFLERHERSELFLQTKWTSLDSQDDRVPYDPEASFAQQVEQSFNSSLEHLGVSYLDSYILHGPMGYPGLVPGDQEVYQAMEKLHEEGKAKQIGLSNVNLSQLKVFMSFAYVKPAFVQNRCFARNGWDREVREYCQENGIVYQGFSLLTANPHVVTSSTVAEIAKKYGKTPAQIVFAFCRQIGILPLTGTTDPEHMQQDLDSLQITLSDEEIEEIMGV